MKCFRLNLNGAINHPKIVVWMDENFAAGATWVLQYFENEIRRGSAFHAGETVQIGWMIVLLKGNEQGDLEVWEPRLDNMPVSWIRGANNTFRHLTLQKEMCRQMGVDPEFPAYTQFAVIPVESPKATDDFCMVRDKTAGADSGWRVTRPHQEEALTKNCSLFEIAIGNPMVVPFLALPSGAAVCCAHGIVQITYGPKVIASDTNQFLKDLDLCWRRCAFDPDCRF